MLHNVENRAYYYIWPVSVKVTFIVLPGSMPQFLTWASPNLCEATFDWNYFDQWLVNLQPNGSGLVRLVRTRPIIPPTT